jgi:hypothetical protein
MSETTKEMTNHDVSNINHTYANVIMLQGTPVDVGIGFGLTEFMGADEMVAKYHTMVRLSFEQAKRLAESLNEFLQNIDSKSNQEPE